MAKTNWGLILIIVAVALVATKTVNLGGLFAGAPTQEQPPGTVPTPGGELCIHDGATMTIGPIYDMYATAEQTAEYARVRVTSVGGQTPIDYGYKASSATMAVNNEDSVEIWYGLNSSSFYTNHQTFTVPCTSAFSSGSYDSGAHKLWAISSSGNLSLKTFDEDDGLLNTGSGGSATEALAAGDIVNLEGSFQGVYKKGYSMNSEKSGGILFTFRYNSSLLDDVDLSIDTPGYTVADATTPTFRSSDMTDPSTSNGFSATKTYVLKTWRIAPGLDSNEKVEFTLTLDVDDTNDPPATDNMTIFLDDEDYWIHTVDNSINFGPENNADTNQGDLGRAGINIIIA